MQRGFNLPQWNLSAWRKKYAVTVFKIRYKIKIQSVQVYQPFICQFIPTFYRCEFKYFTKLILDILRQPQ